MRFMQQDEAFAFNDYVENKLDKEPTVCHENLFPDVIFDELKQIAKTHVSLPEELPSDRVKPFWFRKGAIHLNKRIQEISNEFIKPLLSRDSILIGDTAFCLNHPPHDIHVDSRDFRTDLDKKAGIIGYKTVVIPLEIDTDDYPFLFTCNQYFFGPSTRFRKGAEKIDLESKECQRQKDSAVYFSYDYEKDGVKFLEKNNLTKEWYNQYIDYEVPNHTGVPYSSFEGLSIEKENLWKPNNVIIFDSSRIHFAELISKRNATYKLGISLNYGIKI